VVCPDVCKSCESNEVCFTCIEERILTYNKCLCAIGLFENEDKIC
jgi:hypothetical protein